MVIDTYKYMFGYLQLHKYSLNKNYYAPKDLNLLFLLIDVSFQGFKNVKVGRNFCATPKKKKNSMDSIV